MLLEAPRVIGIDPGSRNSGLAVVEGDKLLESAQVIIKKGNSTESLAIELKRFNNIILEWMDKHQPTLLVVEHTSVMRNMNTTKLLTYFETAALMAAASYGCLVERARTKQARKVVLGKGNLDKSDVQEAIYRKYRKSFGQDESEAIVFALYGVSLLQGIPEPSIATSESAE